MVNTKTKRHANSGAANTVIATLCFFTPFIGTSLFRLPQLTYYTLCLAKSSNKRLFDTKFNGG